MKADMVSVVRVSGLVVSGSAPLQRVGHGFQGHAAASIVSGSCGVGRSLQSVQGYPGVAVGHVNQVLQGRRVQLQAQVSKAALRVFQRPRHDGPDLIGGEQLQGEHPGTGQQRAYYLERRVLRGRPHQGNGPAFNVGQYHVLLGLVEAMDLVHEQDGGLPVHALAFPGFGDDAAQVGHPRRDGADSLEVSLSGPRHQACQRGLAGARRPPQD